jgi:hypothetical protein
MLAQRSYSFFGVFFVERARHVVSIPLIVNTMVFKDCKNKPAFEINEES